MDESAVLDMPGTDPLKQDVPAAITSNLQNPARALEVTVTRDFKFELPPTPAPDVPMVTRKPDFVA